MHFVLYVPEYKLYYKTFQNQTDTFYYCMTYYHHSAQPYLDFHEITKACCLFFRFIVCVFLKVLPYMQNSSEKLKRTNIFFIFLSPLQAAVFEVKIDPK